MNLQPDLFVACVGPSGDDLLAAYGIDAATLLALRPGMGWVVVAMTRRGVELRFCADAIEAAELVASVEPGDASMWTMTTIAEPVQACLDRMAACLH